MLLSITPTFIGFGTRTGCPASVLMLAKQPVIVRINAMSQTETHEYIEPSLIGVLHDVPGLEYDQEDLRVNAVLFGNGEFRRLQNSRDIYGLVTSGYNGLIFRDESEFITTGLIASAKDLDVAGIERVESKIHRVLSEAESSYTARFAGHISLEMAKHSYRQEIVRTAFPG